MVVACSLFNAEVSAAELAFLNCLRCLKHFIKLRNLRHFPARVILLELVKLCIARKSCAPDRILAFMSSSNFILSDGYVLASFMQKLCTLVGIVYFSSCTPISASWSIDFAIVVYSVCLLFDVGIGVDF